LNPIALHDQALAFIQSDSFALLIDGQISYEILAKEFEGYWRATIAQELTASMILINAVDNNLPYAVRRKIIKEIWSRHD
jgi:hypothetical protein